MKVKGRYVAQVEVDFEYDNCVLRTTSFSEVNERIKGEWIDKVVSETIADIFHSGNPKITVTKQYADVYEVQKGEEKE